MAETGQKPGIWRFAMDRLLTMDKEQFIARMQSEFRRTMEQVAAAVNEAADGNVINGSEIQVRDLMAEFRRKAFEVAVQMRIDSTESSFSPSKKCIGPTQTEQRPVGADGADGQRAGGVEPHALARPR